MTNPKSLRVVAAGETAPKRERPLSIAQAIATGNYLAELEALHRRIGVVVNDSSTQPRDLAALVRRQVELSKEIHALRAVRDGDPIGDAIQVEDEPFDAGAV